MAALSLIKVDLKQKSKHIYMNDKHTSQLKKKGKLMFYPLASEEANAIQSHTQ